MRSAWCDLSRAHEELPPEDRILLRLYPDLGIQHPQHQEGVHGGEFSSQKKIVEKNPRFTSLPARQLPKLVLVHKRYINL